MAELLVPWTGPAQTGDLHKLSDGTAALAQEEGRLRHIYLFDASGQWVGLQRLSGCRLRCQMSLEWGEGDLPTTMRVRNAQKHYRAVRENVSIE